MHLLSYFVATQSIVYTKNYRCDCQNISVYCTYVGWNETDMPREIDGLASESGQRDHFEHYLCISLNN